MTDPQPPKLMLISDPAPQRQDDVDSILSAPFVQTTEVVLVDPLVVNLIKCVPYKIPKHIENKVYATLQSAWTNVADADKSKITSIFEAIGVNKQISTRLRTIVNEITKDGKIDMDDLPHITELIIHLTDIFQDVKLPPKSDHLIVPVFELLVLIIVASTLANPDELDRWGTIIRAAMQLVKLQVKRSGCSCC